MAIATANKNNGRQWPLVARQVFGFAEMETATAVPLIDLPVGAIVIGGSMVITELFNSATSDTLTVSGGGVSTAAIDADATGGALGRTALTLTGAEQTLGDTVDVAASLTGGGATTGAGYVELTYIITSRANENQPA